jgi:hypothetical protein
MSFHVGDVVVLSTRKGAVQYTVDNAQPEQYGQVLIKSNNTGKTQLVETDRLTLVTAARNAVHATEEVLNAALLVPQSTLSDAELDQVTSRTEHPLAIWEVELTDAAGDPKRPYLLTVDHVTTAHKSYNAACDALILAARAGFKHYAVIDYRGERKATRTAA